MPEIRLWKKRRSITLCSVTTMHWTNWWPLFETRLKTSSVKAPRWTLKVRWMFGLADYTYFHYLGGFYLSFVHLFRTDERAPPPKGLSTSPRDHLSPISAIISTILIPLSHFSVRHNSRVPEGIKPIFGEANIILWSCFGFCLAAF